MSLSKNNQKLTPFNRATTYSERVPMRNFPPQIPIPEET